MSHGLPVSPLGHSDDVGITLPPTKRLRSGLDAGQAGFPAGVAVAASAQPLPSTTPAGTGSKGRRSLPVLYPAVGHGVDVPSAVPAAGTVAAGNGSGNHNNTGAPSPGSLGDGNTTGTPRAAAADSSTGGSVADESEEARLARREKNKQSAASYRKRKRETQAVLEARVAHLESEHVRLTTLLHARDAEATRLRDELDRVRASSKEHESIDVLLRSVMTSSDADIADHLIKAGPGALLKALISCLAQSRTNDAGDVTRAKQ